MNKSSVSLASTKAAQSSPAAPAASARCKYRVGNWEVERPYLMYEKHFLPGLFTKREIQKLDELPEGEVKVSTLKLFCAKAQERVERQKARLSARESKILASEMLASKRKQQLQVKRQQLGVLKKL